MLLAEMTRDLFERLVLTQQVVVSAQALAFCARYD
jgi:hypothetical protein